MTQRVEINRLIDQALLAPGRETFIAVAVRSPSLETVKLAERVRYRASRLCRNRPQAGKKILWARDRLILLLYRYAVPDGAFAAWCDATLKKSGAGVLAGISGLLISPQGRLTRWISREIRETDAVMGEAIAVAAVMQVALEDQVERLRVHSDCGALVQLWLERREDPRLDTIRDLAAKFRWFELCRISGFHNQPADRLAKRVLKKASHGEDDPVRK